MVYRGSKVSDFQGVKGGRTLIAADTGLQPSNVTTETNVAYEALLLLRQMIGT